MDLTDNRYTYEDRFAVGIDIGQAYDPTAICVVQQTRATAKRQELPRVAPIYSVRHLERLRLGMTYPQQVEHIRKLLTRPGLAEHEPTVWLDYTGVGRPVFDLFKQARLQRVTGVTITSGHLPTQSEGRHNVPKGTLVSRLQALLHSGELKIAASLPDAPALMRELQEFRVKFTEAGNATWNAREGAHDDLVLALALAVYGLPAHRPVTHMSMRWAQMGS